MAQDPYKYFRVEARELLDQLGQGVMDLERGAAGPDLIPRLLRLAHTLKGAARVIRQPEIADQAHAIEDTLAPFRDSTAGVRREHIETVLKLIDRINSRVTSLTPPGEAEAPAGRPLPEEALRTVRADIAEMDALLDGIAETHSRVGALRKDLGSVQRSRYLLELLAEERATRRRMETERPAGDVGRDKAGAILDDLRATVGGLGRSLAFSLDHMDRELRRVRDSAEQLRLVPAGALFTSLERIARDAAQAQGKRVVFEGRGGDVRLDAHVLGAVQGALLQLVRNGVAHGVEPESDRRQAGKPSEGKVTLDVARRGRRVGFRCTDDGRGVDLEALRRAAQRKGLLPSEIKELSAEATLHLLLRGGISTSVAVDGVSGRGIGLDVVREAAERLGGEVTVRTEAGKGTTVELIVPMSLASLAALVGESSGVVAAIPLDVVQGTLRVAPGAIVRSAQGESVVYEDRSIPFVPLHTVLRRNAAPSRAGRHWSAIVVRGNGGLAAVGMDRLSGTGNVVLRPIPELAPATPAVAGAFLDPEGNFQLVLDADGLVAEAQRSDIPQPEATVAPPSVLVIDDSLTTRMLEQSILESAGYHVELATSGEEGIEKARRKRYALFLVDIEMPGMDGFAFLERAHADPLLRGVPSILVTSRTSLEDRRRGQELGAQGYIAKNEFEQSEFLDRIQRLVS